jgi:hypothetical protein
MFEFIIQNVVGAYAKKHVLKMLDALKSNSFSLFSIIALASYLYYNRSALSYSNVASFYDIPAYPNAFSLIQNSKNYLRSYSFDWDFEDNNQDFYILRSKLFAYNTYQILIENFKEDFSKIVESFIKKESRFNIARFDVFKRKAYDADFFAKIFDKEKAVSIYQLLYSYDKNPYILQQEALCLAIFNDYKAAFIEIDKAISAEPHNFSFKNSQAIIMFEANKYIGSNEAISHMHYAMKILRSCYLDDKRKIYHAQKFAEFSIYFYEKLNVNDYVSDALKWLLETIQDLPVVKTQTAKLIERLRSITAKNQ